MKTEFVISQSKSISSVSLSFQHKERPAFIAPIFFIEKEIAVKNEHLISYFAEVLSEPCFTSILGITAESSSSYGTSEK